ncbi:MAG TPA: hypothetical protein VF980_09970 [Thermoanaerobaculia bacterium]
MTSSESAGASAPSRIATNPNRAPDYILLDYPNQIRSYDYSGVGVRGLHVRGTLTNHGFIPAGEIQGNGSFCADGKDWLSLADLTVHTASEGKNPTAPYILGCASASGFQPASRTVVAQ